MGEDGFLLHEEEEVVTNRRTGRIFSDEVKGGEAVELVGMGGRDG